MREIEKEKDNIKRKMEMEINSKKIKRFNDKIKNIYFNKIKIKKKKFLFKSITLIIIIAGLIIISIILLDKYLK